MCSPVKINEGLWSEGDTGDYLLKSHVGPTGRKDPLGGGGA